MTKPTKHKKKIQAGSTAAIYISRTQAVKKLQISLATFRRLCILKGIYPREPNNKKKAGRGSTAPNTFYYRKDIQYLLHEPVLDKLRQLKTHTRKVKRAIAKREFSAVSTLELQKPEYGLSHIIKERYPSFIDALRDLDDALSTVNLFATLHVDNAVIKSADVEECRRLSNEFQLYVIETRSLRKVFLSIKGIYFQAEIQGQLITWIVPHAFSQNTPSDVDFRVMATFLELYRSLVGFVNFKLFTDMGLLYPLLVNIDHDRQAGGLSGYIMNKKDIVEGSDDGKIAEKSTAAHTDSTPRFVMPVDTEEESSDEVNDVAEVEGNAETSAPKPILPSDPLPSYESISQQESQTSKLTHLFADVVFYLNREVPRSLMEFVIKSFGGRVGWDDTAGACSPFKADNVKITHHIIDRPLTGIKTFDRRTYIQPQWVFDSINSGRLLDTRPYAPGETLPPHLSPFVRADLEADIAMAEADEEVATVEDKDIEEVEGDEVAGDDEETAAVVKLSKAGKSINKKHAGQNGTQALEDIAATMMSKKDRYLYSRILAAKEKKEEAVKKLAQKRKAVQKRA
ncbi:hypothetical protein SmJEL517_g05397 [Synchytrium microbalum]|uniref:Pescadillo homolog n=1 Tax=Synchytrium microbalum TaxID=1806994 RepID=A0A507C189_9FUNG|nr:uncharacterized protein SmJEL517_g05397 [Synchytrium microbalum]TPX31273.1 hypothetical protein SmJEL517_g05397 [Synchytrium microbalum]